MREINVVRYYSDMLGKEFSNSADCLKAEKEHQAKIEKQNKELAQKERYEKARKAFDVAKKELEVAAREAGVSIDITYEAKFPKTTSCSNSSTYAKSKGWNVLNLATFNDDELHDILLELLK